MFRIRLDLRRSRALALICCLAAPLCQAQERPVPAGADPELRGGLADKAVVGELPDIPEEVSQKVALAFSKKDWKTARKLYEEILAIAPENALALANIGIVSFQMDDYKAAQAYLEKAVAKNPKLTQARITLGMAYFYQDDLYLAISHLTRVLNDDPKNSRAHLYLAVVAQMAGWGNAAEDELRKAIAIDPKYAEAHFNLALVYLEQQPPAIELAKRHYYQALDLGAKPDKKIVEQLK